MMGLGLTLLGVVLAMLASSRHLQTLKRAGLSDRPTGSVREQVRQWDRARELKRGEEWRQSSRLAVLGMMLAIPGALLTLAGAWRALSQ